MHKSFKLILTREKEDIEKERRNFEKEGIEVIPLPLIRTIPLNWEIPNKKFDYLVFQSKKAVKFFLEKKKIPEETKIIAVGEKTKKFLEEKGYRVFLIPEKENAQGLIQVFEKLQKGSVLIPRSKVGREELINFLKEKGFEVYPIDVYTTESVIHEKEKFLNALSEGNFIAFYSPSSVKSFFANLQKHGISKDKLNLKFIAIGETTKEELKKHGIEEVKVPKKPRTEEIIKLIKNWH